MLRRLAAVAALPVLLLALCGPAGSAVPAAGQEAGVPVISTQVLVVGGTPAGIAAAVAAARRGLRVELVCGRPYLGGILTGGMMDQWDLNLGPDGQRIEGGIFREIYDRLGEGFSPRTAERLFLSMVEAHPQISLHLSTDPVAVVTEGTPLNRRVVSVTVRDGQDDERFAIAAPVVIDATDDAEVAAMAGARYDVGRQDTGLDTKMQAVTLMFAVNGVDWTAAEDGYDPSQFGSGGTTGRKIWGFAKLMRSYRPLSPEVIVRDLNLSREPSGRVTINAVDVLGVDGRSSASTTAGMAIAKTEIRHLMGFLRTRVPGFEHARLAAFADELYIRETRHVLGLYTLTAQDVWSGVVPYDSIGLASYPLDTHPSYRGEEPAYAPVRHVYGVPFRAMVPYGFDNLLVAGPSISATHVAAGSARIIPTTIEEGQAAGTAAAFSLHAHVDFTKIALRIGLMRDLRTMLAASGAVIDVARR